MKKYKITLILLLAIIFILSGCYKEPIEIEPDACFSADVTAIEERESVTFDFCGGGQFIVFYAGDEGHVYNEPGNTGKIVSTEILKTNYMYRYAGTYVATSVATSYGDFGNEKKQDVQQITITVTPPTE